MEDDNEADIQSRRSNEVLAREGIDTGHHPDQHGNVGQNVAMKY